MNYASFLLRLSERVLAVSTFGTAGGGIFLRTNTGSDALSPGNTLHFTTVYDANVRGGSSGRYSLARSGDSLDWLTPIRITPASIPGTSAVLANEFLGGPASETVAPPVYRTIVDGDVENSSGAILGDPITPQTIAGQPLNLVSSPSNIDAASPIVPSGA